jgi:energy-coupling factor transporter transmembrane protein EcfT
LLLFGAAVWAALSYINHSHYSVLARDDIALWTFFHFTGILWYSVIVLRTTSLWTLITQLEGAGKRLLGPWLWIGQTALISVLAMRFIPVLRRNAHHLRADAKIRKRLAHNPLKWSDAFRFITPLVMLSIIHSEAVAEALWTRGWRPDIIPVAEKWTWSDTLVSVSLGFFLILAWKEKI